MAPLSRGLASSAFFGRLGGLVESLRFLHMGYRGYIGIHIYIYMYRHRGYVIGFRA